MSASSTPEIFWVRQRTRGPRVGDPAARTVETLQALDLSERVHPGETVAVGVGSRGITDLAAVVRATVQHLRGLGLEPFIVPAMGSHGGGEASGQAALLAGYAVTEEEMGCPVRAQMEVVEVGRSDLGFAIHFDRLAAEADHVVVVNRIKPHTMFEGPVESGLAKMLLIGLGKRTGAETHHRASFDHPWAEVVTSSLPQLAARVNVLAGVAIVENEADQTAHIEAVTGEEILDQEPALLARAKALIPRLPFDDFDIVLVDEIGKDISGTGWDTNTLGRKDSLHEAGAKRPRVRTIAVRGLTPGTHGNALGVGLAELCRTRVLEQMDREVTWVNALTCGDIPAAMSPIHFATDRELLAACTTRSGVRDLPDARLCWIRNTLELGVVACSVAHLDETRSRDDLETLTPPSPMPLGPDGNLPDLLPIPADGGVRLRGHETIIPTDPDG